VYTLNDLYDFIEIIDMHDALNEQAVKQAEVERNNKRPAARRQI